MINTIFFCFVFKAFLRLTSERTFVVLFVHLSLFCATCYTSSQEIMTITLLISNEFYLIEISHDSSTPGGFWPARLTLRALQILMGRTIDYGLLN